MDWFLNAQGLEHDSPEFLEWLASTGLPTTTPEVSEAQLILFDDYSISRSEA